MTTIVWPVDAIAGVPTNTGRMLRQTLAPLLAGATAARPLGARSGVRPGTSPTTVTATSTTWTMGLHAGILDLESSGLAGPYAYAVNVAETGAVTAAHATLARVDIVWLRLDDPAESDGSAAPVVVAGYTVGTGGGFGLGGGVPATPARCMVLATIQVPASGGGAPTVIWVAPYTVAAGAPTPVWSAADRDAKFPVSYDGLPVYRLDTHEIQTYNGTSWVSAPGYVTSNTATASVAGINSTAFVNLVVAPVITGDGVKRFKITGTIPLLMSTVAGDGFELRLLEYNSATVVKKARVIPAVAVGISYGASGLTLTATDIPVAGSRIYALQVCRVNGTGTGTVYADTAGYTIEIIVERI